MENAIPTRSDAPETVGPLPETIEAPVPNERWNLWSTLRDTTFRSLRHRNYRRYFLGQIVSFTGSWMQSAALMWLLFDLTNDPRWPSWILAAQVTPTLLLGAWGGGLADRHPKRTLILLTQSIFLVHAIVLTLVVANHLLEPWLILGLMAVSGIVQAVDLPARLAFVPDLIPRADLINAIGLNSLLFNSARAIGPALAGGVFLIAEGVAPEIPGLSSVMLGAIVCFALNALSFVAVLVALWGIATPGASALTDRHERGRFWNGFVYLYRHSWLGFLVLLTLAFCIFGWPLITVLPAYTKMGLGLNEQSYSLLISAVGAGALFGALTTATFGSTSRRHPFLIVGALAAAAGIFGLSQAVHLGAGASAPSARVGVSAVCCAAAGFGLILFLSTGQSTMQLAVPDASRGRVMALWAMTLSASAPLGHVMAGIAVNNVGVAPVLLGMSAGVAAVAVILIALLPVHRVERG